MKTLRKLKKEISILFLGCFLFSCTDSYSNPVPEPIPTPPIANSIKIALLLDTSGSMDGLLEQAKSQLWKIVNQLAMAKKNDLKANLEIALYQYGNDGLNSREGYIQNVLPLTSDLDELSEKLFALRTNGGEEYCGHVIQTATNQLNWNNSVEDLNLIFIAGNEPFNQGSVDYNQSCKNAVNKNITVNTIFCGDYETGINTSWLHGAKLTEGSYMNIDMNQKTVYVETPYDKQIDALNDSLNNTYIAYGNQGANKKSNQIAQDNNSAQYSTANKVSRTVSKSSHLYNNEKWDLVDAKKNKSFDINEVDTKTLPKEMQNLNEQEKIIYIEKKAEDRKKIQKQIQTINQSRLAYIAQQKSSNNTESLDDAMMNAIKKQAKNKGFTFDESETTTSLLEEEPTFTKAYVDFDYFEQVTKEAKEHRKNRLVDFNTFVKKSKEANTIILDTRSKEMYDRMHIKGAIHLNFADFTQQRLAQVIPDTSTIILIYCNNNFKQEPIFREVFPSKGVMPIKAELVPFDALNIKTLALNIPTYINLFGYGYKNVFELSELVSTKHKHLELEGSDVLN